MTQSALTAQAIADYLSQNPAFFEEHADVFASLSVPHPHQGHAISLGERQVMTLRARVREYEHRLAQLLHNAGGNERISFTLAQWCARMLAEPDATQLPELLVDTLTRQFELDAVALRVWGLAGLPDGPFTQDVTVATRHAAQRLTRPYCGTAADQPAAAWLAEPPASLAVLPLTTFGTPDIVGLLVLGSGDPERYTADMGTSFLELIALLAGAALTRLATAAPEAA